MALEGCCDAIDSSELRNYYVAHFAALNQEEMRTDPDAAVRRGLDAGLSRYRVIGFQDELPAAAGRLREATGLRGDFSTGSSNRTSAADRDAVSGEARRIAGANALDRGFYDQVRQEAPG